MRASRWYAYPDCFVSMLVSSSSWSAWRNKSERLLRGKGTRKQAYYEGLVEEVRLHAEQDGREFGCKLPWDDEPLLEGSGAEESESGEGSGDEDREQEEAPQPKRAKGGRDKDVSSGKGAQPQQTGSKKKATSSSSSSSTAGGAKSEPPVAAKPDEAVDPLAHKRSPLNLYWIDRSRLPCLFYDELGMEAAEVFRVLPICCSTYHCKHSKHRIYAEVCLYVYLCMVGQTTW